jgi:hypothetical protein
MDANTISRYVTVFEKWSTIFGGRVCTTYIGLHVAASKKTQLSTQKMKNGLFELQVENFLC